MEVRNIEQLKEVDVIYNQDCLKGLKQLPDNSIDLVITDPPMESSIEATTEKNRQNLTSL